jgi:hypothetical protein
MSQIIKIPLTETQKKDAETAAEYAAEFNRLDNKIDAETENRTNAVTNLKNYIDTEINNRKNEDTNLQNNLDNEINSRKNADTNLQNNLNAEINNRKNADTTLQNNLDNEISERESAVENLQSKINTETSERNTAISTLQNNLTTEINNLQNADTAFQNSLNSEIQARQSKDDELAAAVADEIENRNAAIEDAQNAIMSALGDNEAAQRIKDQELREQIQNATASQAVTISALSGQLSNAVNTHNNDINNLRNTLNAEISNREKGDTNLAEQISALEISLGNSTDSLTAAITTEKNSRTSKDTDLQNQINNLSRSLSTESTARANAITAVNNRIDALQEQFDNLPAQQVTLTAAQSSGFAQIGTNTYTGSAQSPSIKNYNASVHILSGDTSKTTAGTYTIYIEPKPGMVWSDGTNTKKSVSWTISPKKLAKPYATTTNFAYDGAAKVLQVTGYDSATMTQTGTTSESAAGNYSVTYALKNKTNYTWSDDTTANVVINWTIGAKKLTKPYFFGHNPEYYIFDYDGTELHPFFSSAGSFDSTTMTKSGTERAVNAGTYEITISLKDPVKYQWADGTTDDVVLEWQINKRNIPKTSISGTGNYDYTGSTINVLLSYLEADAKWFTISGTTSATDAGTYTVTFTLKDTQNTQWSNNTTAPYSLAWKIISQTLTQEQSNLTQDKTITYDGNNHTLAEAFSNWDATLFTAADVDLTEAGTYTVAVTLDSNRKWYDQTAATKNVTVTVSPLLIDKPVATGATEFIYDGKVHRLTTSGFLGAYMNVDVPSAAFRVGNYQYVYSLKNPTSVHWKDGTTADVVFNFQILPLKLPKPTATTSQFIYDGTEKNFLSYLENYDTNYLYVKSGTTKATNAGNYTLTIKIYFTEQVQWEDDTTDDITFEWQILPRSIPKPTAGIKQFTYDGTAKTLEIANYDSNYITKSGTESATTARSYSVTYALKDKDNSQWSDGTTANVVINWQILKATLARPSATTTYFLNDGNTKTLTLKNFDSSKMTQGGKISASAVGTYRASFTLKDSVNYQFSGTSENTVYIDWEIGGTAIPVPTVTALPPEDSNGATKISWTFTISNFNPDLMDYALKDKTGSSFNLDSVAEKNSSYFTLQTEFNANNFVNTQFDNNHNGLPFSVIFSLKDKVNYQWQGGGTDDKSVSVTPEPYRLPVNSFAQDIFYSYDSKGYHKWFNFSSIFNGYSGFDISTAAFLKHNNSTYWDSRPTSYKDAGTYTEHLTPQKWCVWNNGTFGTFDFTFTIDQADWTFTVTDDDGNSYTIDTADNISSVNSATYHFYPKKLSRSFTVTNTCGGTAKCEKVSSSYPATIVIINENTFDVLPSTQNYTNKKWLKISVTPPDSNYKASPIFYIYATNWKDLNPLSWEQIAELAHNKTLNNYFDYGATKSFTMTGDFYGVDFGTGTQVTAVYLDEGRDDRAPVGEGYGVEFAVLRYATSNSWVPFQPTANTPAVSPFSINWFEPDGDAPDIDISSFPDDLKNYLGEKCYMLYPAYYWWYRKIGNLGYNEIFGGSFYSDSSGTDESARQKQFEYFSNGNFPRVNKSTTDNTIVDFMLREQEKDHGGYLVHGEKNNWTVTRLNNNNPQPTVITIFVCKPY